MALEELVSIWWESCGWRATLTDVTYFPERDRERKKLPPEECTLVSVAKKRRVQESPGA